MVCATSVECFDPHSDKVTAQAIIEELGTSSDFYNQLFTPALRETISV